MTPVRVVLDTNCLVSALLFKSRPLAALRLAWQRGALKPLVCRETVAELIRVLPYPKFCLNREDVDALLAEFLPFTEICLVKHPYATVPGLGDQGDAVFVHLARQHQADALVSGDKHLLRLAQPGVIILAPADFLRTWP